jgi:hypothetical protein
MSQSIYLFDLAGQGLREPANLAEMDQVLETLGARNPGVK